MRAILRKSWLRTNLLITSFKVWFPLNFKGEFLITKSVGKYSLTYLCYVPLFEKVHSVEVLKIRRFRYLSNLNNRRKKFEKL